MKNDFKSIGATGYRGGFNLNTLAVAFGALVISGAVCSAAFSENFQNQTVGAPPSPTANPNNASGTNGWRFVNTNGTLATANVAAEGANQFLAFRDLTNGTGIMQAMEYGPKNTARTFETAGSLEFDIRFNQGINAQFSAILNGSKQGVINSGGGPMQLQWFHAAFNTNNPLQFRGFGSTATVLTNNFPIGSWQTVRIDFVSAGDATIGAFSVSWNGLTNNYSYAGSINNLGIDMLEFTTAGADMTTGSIDIDNIRLIPEPGALALFTAAMLGLRAWGRRRK